MIKENKRFDRMSISILAFIIMFGIGTAFIYSGVVPEIFKQGKLLDEALLFQKIEIQVQEQTEHEDEQRRFYDQKAMQQRVADNIERDIQQNNTLNRIDKVAMHIDNQTNELENKIGSFINESEQRSLKGVRKEI